MHSRPARCCRCCKLGKPCGLFPPAHASLQHQLKHLWPSRARHAARNPPFLNLPCWACPSLGVVLLGITYVLPPQPCKSLFTVTFCLALHPPAFHQSSVGCTPCFRGCSFMRCTACTLIPSLGPPSLKPHRQNPSTCLRTLPRLPFRLSLLHPSTRVSRERNPFFVLIAPCLITFGNP